MAQRTILICRINSPFSDFFLLRTVQKTNFQTFREREDVCTRREKWIEDGPCRSKYCVHKYIYRLVIHPQISWLYALCSGLSVFLLVFLNSFFLNSLSDFRPLPFFSSLSLGIASLVRLLSSAGEESQPGLAVLLCEILTAVFLSLFVHGMATHSSNELFRIMGHPLNSKLWVTVFGGGARIPVIEKPSSPTRTPPPG